MSSLCPGCGLEIEKISRYITPLWKGHYYHQKCLNDITLKREKNMEHASYRSVAACELADPEKKIPISTDQSRLKLLYLAGSFRARNNPFGYNTFEQERNIRKAETWMVRVNDIPGWFGISPQTMTRNLQGAHEESVYLEGTMELMLRCDAVLMLPGWEGSEGAKAEYEEAKRTGLTVYECWPEFHSQAMKELVK